MGTKKIDDFTAATTAVGTDVALISQGGVTKKLPLSLIPIPDATQTALNGKTPLLSAAVVAATAAAPVAGVISPYSTATRTDAATVTSGSATVSDTAITAADSGRAVSGTGIPANTFVNTVTAGTSFTMADANGSAVNATVAATSITVQAVTALSIPLPALSGLTAGAVYPVQRAANDRTTGLLRAVCSGTDTFDSGATALNLPVPGELRHLQVVSIGGTKYWKVTGGNTPATFDGRRSLFNATPASFRKLRAALAKAVLGTGLCRIAFLGDSTVEGVGIASTATRMAQSMPGQVISLLAAAGYPTDGASGVLQAYTNNAGYWAEWSYANADWSASNGINPTLVSQGANKVLTFTSQTAGTIVDLVYTNNSSAAFTVAIDGGSAVTVTPGAGLTFATRSFTGLANTTHTVVITAQAAGATIVSAHVHSSSTAGLQFWNAGIGSSQSTHWYGGNLWISGSKIVAAWAANLTIIKLGINDAYAGNISVANYTTYMQGIITNALTTGDVLLVTPDPGKNVDFAPYLAALYQLAETNNVPLLDLYHRWGDQATANSLGLMSDGLHPNAIGYQDEARAVYAAIAA